MQSTETQSHSQRSLTSLVTSVAHTCQSTLTPIHQLPMIPRNAGCTMTTYYKESLSYEKARLATCFSRKKGCCRPSIKWRRKISQTIHFNPVDSSVLRQPYNLTGFIKKLLQALAIFSAIYRLANRYSVTKGRRHANLTSRGVRCVDLCAFCYKQFSIFETRRNLGRV